MSAYRKDDFNTSCEYLVGSFMSIPELVFMGFVIGLTGPCAGPYTDSNNQVGSSHWLDSRTQGHIWSYNYRSGHHCSHCCRHLFIPLQPAISMLGGTALVLFEE